jgi:hypothetical protein
MKMKLGQQLPDLAHTLEENSQRTSADACWESLAKKWESLFILAERAKVLSTKIELVADTR